MIDLKQSGTRLHVCFYGPLDALLDQRHRQRECDEAAA